MKKRKHFNPEQKVIILRELLEKGIPISQLADKYQIHTNDIYNWRKKLFEQATEIFQPKPHNRTQSSVEQKKIQKLQSQIRDRDEAVAFLVKENIDLKKSIDGDL